jgi:hypothetical protein
MARWPLALALLVAGCVGESSEGAGAVPHDAGAPDVEVDAGGDAGPECGCVDTAGKCHIGTEANYCGSGASTCLPCADWGRACNEARLCVVDPPNCQADADCVSPDPVKHTDECVVPSCQPDGMCAYDIQTLIGEPCQRGAGVCTSYADYAPPTCVTTPASP